MADNQEKDPQLNDQGKADFTTGSTTQGGSNYGQGSSHLGGESYRQGDAKSMGSNYGNETNKFGSSGTDTVNDGSQSPVAGAPDASFADQSMGAEKTEKDINDEAKEQTDKAHFSTKTDPQNHRPTAGDSGDTARDVAMNLDDDSQ